MSKDILFYDDIPENVSDIEKKPTNHVYVCSNKYCHAKITCTTSIRFKSCLCCKGKLYEV